MRHQDIAEIIPDQFTGTELEMDSSIELKDPDAAKGFYEIAKKRLLDVNNWNRISGIITAKFQLVDEKGNEVTRNVKQGDYFKIDIPGPGNKEGDGYDWVLVEEVKEVNQPDIQSLGIRVRPSDNPFSEKNETAHFYSEEATSSFIVMREGLKVTAWIVDRNLKPNTDSESIGDKIRDSAVGITAIGIFSKMQWQGLADGLVRR